MKKLFILSLILALSAGFASANSSSTSKVGIDQGASRMFVGSGGTLDIETGGDITYNGLSSGAGNFYVAKATWTPSIGTAPGQYSTGIQIPSGAVIIGGYVDTITNVSGTSNTVLGFGIQSGADIYTHTIGGGSSYFTTALGPYTLIPSFTAAPIKLTAARYISAIIGTASGNGTSSLLSGKVNLFVEYYLSN